MDSRFVIGEKIDLCAPQADDFATWAGWFNDAQITRFLPQGVFPNCIEAQQRFFHGAIQSGRFVALVKSKTGKLLGVVSLSDIDHAKRACQTSHVCPVRDDSAPLAALEAVALVTAHAFEQLGVERVWLGQVYPGLKGWGKKLQILGYKPEGILRKEFRKGRSESDVARLAIVLDDYLALKARRGGALWPGAALAQEMLTALREPISLCEQLEAELQRLYREHDARMSALEAAAKDALASDAPVIS